jgi:omega-6 fatty acid desaturase (delta-12 desaturase)
MSRPSLPNPSFLQHTDTDVPHLAASEFSYMRGAFLSIDRPYGPLFDFLHHKIGSTHVAHHIDCTIPHYHALEATNAIKAAFPKAYLYDPTPVHRALWRVAANCVAVKKEQGSGRYLWVPP